MHQNGEPRWRLHTKLYKGARNISANNSEAVGHEDLRLGQIVYILVFYNINFLGFFHGTVSNLIFCCVTVKTKNPILPFGLGLNFFSFLPTTFSEIAVC